MDSNARLDMNRERLVYILMICQEFSTLPLDAVESIFGKFGHSFLPFDLKVGLGLGANGYGGDVGLLRQSISAPFPCVPA